MNCCKDESNISVTKQVFKNGVTHHRKTCTKCNKFLGYAPQKLCKETTKIYFGIHKHEYVKDLPHNYLKWLLEQDWVKSNLKDLIVEILN
tara:strand:- start:691 stop:960 length:270 start_codon:yes stop_codon:yes gene_type:complete